MYGDENYCRHCGFDITDKGYAWVEETRDGETCKSSPDGQHHPGRVTAAGTHRPA